MHLSPTETATRFGVSIKALRLYESRGLLTPLRSEAGWRTYGPDQIARLHQILALKRLGLSLARIGQILAGGCAGRGAGAAGTGAGPRQRAVGAGAGAGPRGAGQAQEPARLFPSTISQPSPRRRP